jgi:hypothetical protein
MTYQFLIRIDVCLLRHCVDHDVRVIRMSRRRHRRFVVVVFVEMVVFAAAVVEVGFGPAVVIVVFVILITIYFCLSRVGFTGKGMALFVYSGSYV